MSARDRRASGSVLSHLKRRLVGFLGLRLAVILWCVVGLTALFAVALDAVVILSDGVRACAPWALVAGGAAVVGLAAMALVRLGEVRVARQFESSHAALGTQLTNAVQLASRPADTATGELLRSQAVELGRRRARHARAWPVVRRAVTGSCTVGLLTLLLWGAGWGLFADVLRAVAPRFLDPRGDHPPYSRVRLEVEPGDAEVLYGGQCEVRARAAGPPVEKLYLVARRGGEATETPMFVAPDRTFFQTVVNLRAETVYHVTDGRARSRRHTIRIRRTPQITMVQVGTQFPDYTALPPRSEQLTGEALHRPIDKRLPLGSRLTFRVASNRPLASGTLALTPLMGGEGAAVPLRLDAQGAFVEGGFLVKEPVVFTLSVTDAEGLVSAEPRAGRVTILPDSRPRIAVLEPGKHAVATPNVDIPIRVEAEDDYAVRRVLWFRSLNRSVERPVDMPLERKGSTARVETAGAFRLGELGVEPGDVIEYFFEAVDNDPAGPNIATSRVYRVQIISMAEYQEMLRRAAAQKALFESYRALGDELRRLAERAQALEKKARELADKGGGTPEEREALRKEARALARDMAHYRRSLQKALGQPPLFDIEDFFREHLAKQRRQLERLQKEMDAAAEGSLTPEELAKIARSMSAMSSLEQADVGEPVRLLLAVVRVIVRAQMFVRLYQEQVEVVRLAERFRTRAEELSAVERRELEELGRREREIHDGLEELLEELPDLVAQLPPEEAYDLLRESVRAFIKGVREAKIAEDLEAAGKKFAALDGPGGYPPARDAKEKMEKFISEVEAGALVGMGKMCLKFHPVLGAAMANALGQILAAMGMGPGQGGSGTDGVGLFGGDAALYGPHAELARSQGGGGGPATREGRGPEARATGDGADPHLAAPGAPPRVRLQRDAKFPLRYRDLVGDYFRAVAESQSE